MCFVVVILIALCQIHLWLRPLKYGILIISWYRIKASIRKHLFFKRSFWLFNKLDFYPPTRSLFGPTAFAFQLNEWLDGQLGNPSPCLLVRTTYLKILKKNQDSFTFDLNSKVLLCQLCLHKLQYLNKHDINFHEIK